MEASSADGANIGYRFFQNYSDRTRHLNLSQTVKRQLVNGFIKDYKTLLEVRKELWRQTRVSSMPKM